ncbi:MAG: hypothetical protein IH840_01275, partial [Candidatus Heimdallarchaeota archaeon]|nr:hypothetical protein [Candidatus Heimdallarchaeota archaeon]
KKKMTNKEDKVEEAKERLKMNEEFDNHKETAMQKIGKAFKQYDDQEFAKELK